MQSKQETVCIKCGTKLPAGINFRQVKDDTGMVIGARCYNACRTTNLDPATIDDKLACGHESRFKIEVAGLDLKACVACVAIEAIELGKNQADDHDRFWAAMGVLSSEISVDQAITKWKAMEAVMRAAKALRFKEAEEVGHFILHGADLAQLHMALHTYDQQPNVEPSEVPV